MVLSSPKEGMIFGGLSHGWSLKRTAPGEGKLLSTLKVGFREGDSGGDAAQGAEGGVWNGATSCRFQTSRFKIQLSNSIKKLFGDFGGIKLNL